MIYKPEIKTIKNDKFEMDYMVFGEGKEFLVILPGLSLKPVTISADAIAAAYSCFAEKYTVYLFDRRKNISDGYSISDMADDTAAAMKTLGISDADIFGTSQGGMMAQLIAINYPELAHSLILGSTLSRQNDTVKAVIEHWLELAQAGDNIGLNRSFFEKVYSKEYIQQYSEIFSAMEKEGTPEELERFAILAKACIGFDCYDSLDNIKCPVFVIGSKQDNTVSGDSSVEIAEKLGCKIYMYEGYGHAVYDEAPDYKERMMNFLA